ncbi:hypothetical protein D0864_14338 [Hortaea werneckii]|uniref:CFEM domain-containing protein n=1 Tax=Hortaea werneckii TaxID=91943 RepID=A0A3M7CII9_HORWE|nr:hypothetical protein D0864_14338 [Hortaea werneckii]
MRSTVFTLAALAAASLTSAAVSAPDYPDCSLNCVEKAIGQTSCAMDDYYCQCTEGRQQILDSGVGCLCHTVLQEVNKLCKSALQAKGETYTAPDVGLEACAGGGSSAGSSSSSSSDSDSGSGTSAPAASTSTSTSSSSSSSSSSADGDASSEQQEEGGSGDSEESGAQGLRKVYQGAVVIGALAVGVAIL